MLLRMKSRHYASPDGRTSFWYEAGALYSESTTPRLSADLFQVFLEEDWAEEMSEAPFRDSESASAVASQAPATPTVVAEPQPPAEATPVAASTQPAATADTPAAPSESAGVSAAIPADVPTPEPVKPAKKGAGPAPSDPAPGSSEPS